MAVRPIRALVRGERAVPQREGGVEGVLDSVAPRRRRPERSAPARDLGFSQALSRVARAATPGEVVAQTQGRSPRRPGRNGPVSGLARASRAGAQGGTGRL